MFGFDTAWIAGLFDGFDLAAASGFAIDLSSIMSGVKKMKTKESFAREGCLQYMASLHGQPFDREDRNILHGLSQADRERKQAYYKYLNRNAKYF